MDVCANANRKEVMQMMNAAMIQMAPSTDATPVVSTSQHSEASAEHGFGEVLGSAMKASETDAEPSVSATTEQAQESSAAASVDTELMSILSVLMAQGNARVPVADEAATVGVTPKIDALLAGGQPQAVQAAVVATSAAVAGGEASELSVAMPTATAIEDAGQAPVVAVQSRVTDGGLAVDSTAASVTTAPNSASESEALVSQATTTKAPVAGRKMDIRPDVEAVASTVTEPNWTQQAPEVAAQTASKPVGEKPVNATDVQTSLAAQMAVNNTAVRVQSNVSDLPTRVFEVVGNDTQAVAGVSQSETNTGTGGDAAASGEQGRAGSFLLQGGQGSTLGTKQVSSTAATAQARPYAELHQRVIDQVVRDVTLSRSNGTNDIVVRLSPPELGSLRLQITQDATGVTSQIQANNSQVRSLLQANLPMLVDALSNAGVRMDSITVAPEASFGAMMQNSSQGSANQQAGDQKRRFGGGTGMMVGALSAAGAAAAANVDNAGYSWLA